MNLSILVGEVRGHMPFPLLYFFFLPFSITFCWSSPGEWKVTAYIYYSSGWNKLFNAERMSHRWTPNIWVKLSRACPLWKTLAHKPLLFSGTFHCRAHWQQPYCFKAGCPSPSHIHLPWIRVRKAWLCRANQVRFKLGLHTSTLYLNSSTSRWSSGLNQHMSRVRNTLGTVSKAVSGTHTDLLAKISRLKPNAFKAGKNAETIVESSSQAEENVDTSIPRPATPPTLTTSNAAIDTSSTTASAPACVDTFDKTTSSTKPRSHTQATVADTALPVRVVKEKRIKCVAEAGGARKLEETKPSPDGSEMGNKSSKENTAIFHPSTFSVQLDETYNYLAHHINSYFSSSTKTQDKKVDHVDNSTASAQSSELMSVSDKPDCAAPAPQPSLKKGLGRYLSYSAPTVQAFVGSYIAPLVPKFRTVETKSPAVEVKTAEVTPAKQFDATISTEQRAVEEKAKKLLLQREKVRSENCEY